MDPKFGHKSSVDQIRKRFDNDVERFSNLDTGQEAAMDAPLMLELTARAAFAANPGARHMLDVGCGAGNYTLKILQNKADINCDMVDLSAPMLERAHQRVSRETRGEVRTHQGDIRQLQLPQGRYDIIIAAAVLHHLRDDDDWHHVFEKLYNLCAPGGSLWVVDLIRHGSPGIQSIMDAQYGRYLESVGGRNYKEQVMGVIEQEDSPQTLSFQLKLLLQVGFANVEVLYKNAAYAAFGAFKSTLKAY